MNSMKLNEAAQVNTVNNEYVTLINANGNLLKINKADLSKVIKSLMFPSWQVTLAPGEEYDLKVFHYGLYMVRSGDLGSTGLFVIGAQPGAAMIGYHESAFSTDFNSTGKIVMSKKEVNGNIYLKNTRESSTKVFVMQITNYV